MSGLVLHRVMREFASAAECGPGETERRMAEEIVRLREQNDQLAQRIRGIAQLILEQLADHATNPIIREHYAALRTKLWGTRHG
jgi:DNA-binding ferritin-like protein